MLGVFSGFDLSNHSSISKESLLVRIEDEYKLLGTEEGVYKICAMYRELFDLTEDQFYKLLVINLQAEVNMCEKRIANFKFIDSLKKFKC